MFVVCWLTWCFKQEDLHAAERKGLFVGVGDTRLLLTEDFCNLKTRRINRWLSHSYTVLINVYVYWHLKFIIFIFHHKTATGLQTFINSQRKKHFWLPIWCRHTEKELSLFVYLPEVGRWTERPLADGDQFSLFYLDREPRTIDSNTPIGDGEEPVARKNFMFENFLNNILHAFLEYKLMTKLIFIYILQLPLALID